MKRIRNNTEGQVYRCSWQKKGRTYTLTCSSPVKVTVNSGDLEDAMDELISEIMTLTGDGEPYLQFVPDLPQTGTKQGFFDPKYFEIGYNDSVEWKVASGSTDGLTTKGVCQKCALGLGARTNMRRIITTAPHYDVCGFYKDLRLGMMYSEAVLKHLMPHIKKKVKLIPIDVDLKILKKVRKKYFELSFEPDISVTIPSEYDSLSGWRCKVCGMFSVFWYNPRIVKSNTDGIPRTSATEPVVLAEKGPRRFVIVDKNIHDKLCADKTIRGLVLERVALFNPDQMLSPQEVKRLRLPQIET